MQTKDKIIQNTCSYTAYICIYICISLFSNSLERSPCLCTHLHDGPLISSRHLYFLHGFVTGLWSAIWKFEKLGHRLILDRQELTSVRPFTPAAWCCCRWNHNHPMAQRHTKSHESHIPNSLTAILSSLCSNNCSATEVAVPQVVSHAHHCAFYAVYRLAGYCPVVKRRHSKRDCAPLLLTPRGVCVFLKDSGWSIHEK